MGEKQKDTNSRPDFVKPLVGLMIIFEILFILIGYGLLLSGGFSTPWGLFNTLASMGLGVAIPISIYGLWTMKTWGRKLTFYTLIGVVAAFLVPLLFFYRGLKNLHKTKTKIAYGEDVSQEELKEFKESLEEGQEKTEDILRRVESRLEED